MIGPLFRLAIEVAKKVPWWKTAAIAAATAAATTAGGAAGSKAVEKIMRDRKKSPERRIAKLGKLKDSGEITEQQLEELKKTVLDTYAKL
jgi:hypothetical protein